MSEAQSTAPRVGGRFLLSGARPGMASERWMRPGGAEVACGWPLPSEPGTGLARWPHSPRQSWVGLRGAARPKAPLRAMCVSRGQIRDRARSPLSPRVFLEGPPCFREADRWYYWPDRDRPQLGCWSKP